MSIVDKKFGCELVTDKSKIYKFDAIECLVNFVNKEGLSREKMSLLLTNTLDKPEQLIPVDQCLFVHSRKMPSPMGMYLNPVHNHEMAKEISKRNEGKLLTWDELPGLVLKEKATD
jgi:copper chaperone NosL